MNIQPVAAWAPAAVTPVRSDFGQSVVRHLQEVNTLQCKAESLTEAYAAGQDVDLHRVVLATQEAQIGLDLVLQVRNKLIDAYQEMMRMPI